MKQKGQNNGSGNEQTRVSASTASVDPGLELLSTKQEVAAELKMSEDTLSKLLQQYPFIDGSGVEPKIRGRWRVTKSNVHDWFLYVQRQEARHPDARRMRPEEPPTLAEIRGR